LRLGARLAPEGKGAASASLSGPIVGAAGTWAAAARGAAMAAAASSSAMDVLSVVVVTGCSPWTF
jgi:hypothetical protein